MTTRRIVLLEGADGGGKSTLATILGDYLGFLIQGSEGPPKYSGEIDERIERYARLDEVIFDRHPVVSQPIYSSVLRRSSELPSSHLIAEFYLQRPFIIYCRSLSPANQTVKQGEDPAHIKALIDRYDGLIQAYDAWALACASIIYRIGDDPKVICRLAASWWH